MVLIQPYPLPAVLHHHTDYEERQEEQRQADLEEAQQMLGEQLEQDTLTAEDITDLQLVDSEYMSGTRTTIHDFDCKVKGEANRLQYTLEYSIQMPIFRSKVLRRQIIPMISLMWRLEMCHLVHTRSMTVSMIATIS